MQMPAAITATGSTAACKETVKPVMILVARPVTARATKAPMMASGSAHRFTYAAGKDHIVVEQMCLYKETGPELCILHVPDGTLPEPVRVELCTTGFGTSTRQPFPRQGAEQPKSSYQKVAVVQAPALAELQGPRSLAVPACQRTVDWGICARSPPRPTQSDTLVRMVRPSAES